MTVTTTRALPAGRELRRFTVDEFVAMATAGVFRDDERVELIRGFVVEMPPPGPPHAWSVNRLTYGLVTRLGDRAYVSVQNPVRLADSMPLPDLAVVRRDAPQTIQPRPADIVLAIEVADSSLRSDLAVKVPLYAENLIPELWVLDVNGQRVLVFRDPHEGRYGSETSFVRGDSIALVAFPNVEITVDEILGD